LGISLAAATWLLVTTTWADTDSSSGINTAPQSGQSGKSDNQGKQHVSQGSERIAAIDTTAQTTTVKATPPSDIAIKDNPRASTFVRYHLRYVLFEKAQ
jgi:hypothetical protein